MNKENTANTGTGSLDIRPLSEDERKNYPNVIYIMTTNDIQNIDVIKAVISATNIVGMNFVADFGRIETNDEEAVVIRTASPDNITRKVEAALVQGLADVTLKYSTQTEPPSESAVYEYASRVIGELVDNEDLYSIFKDYYGGLRWGMDKDKLIEGLLVHGSDLDIDTVRDYVSPQDLVNIVYNLELDIPYEELSKWRKSLTSEEIINICPEIDPMKLKDPLFASTTQGKNLMLAYKNLNGSKLVRLYKNYPRAISGNGHYVPRPIIPLSKFPIFESLMVEQVLQKSPEAKYSYGPSDVSDIILSSDSWHSQDALVGSINTRLPKEKRYVFDGPGEFDVKARMVGSILHYYKMEEDKDRKARFSELLLRVLDAYTGKGDISESIVKEADESHRNISPVSREVRGVNDIVKNILITGLSSEYAEDFIEMYLQKCDQVLQGQYEQFILNKNEIFLVIIDSLKNFNENSNPEIIYKLAKGINVNEETLQKIKLIATMHSESSAMRKSPEVLLALLELRKHSFSISGTDSPEKLKAQSQFDKVSQPADDLANEARSELNNILLTMLHNLAEQKDDDSNVDNDQLFKALVDRISFTDTINLAELPLEYYKLIDLAHNNNVSAELKSHIVWHIAQQFEYTNSESAHLLVPVVIDIYRVMLGTGSAIQMPSYFTSHGLSAASHVAYYNQIFHVASEEQLLELFNYKNKILNLADLIAKGKLLPGNSSGRPENISGNWEEAAQDLKNVASVINGLDEQYGQYLNLEQVKLKPNIYYPWLLGKFQIFWQRMQFEVSPGNRPTPEIKQLHSVLEEIIRHKLMTKNQDLPEDFDCFKDGGLDSLLIECYNRMIPHSDIQYNNTVWQEGMPFVNLAIRYMPQVLADQFKQEHPEELGLISSIERIKSAE